MSLAALKKTLLKQSHDLILVTGKDQENSATQYAYVLVPKEKTAEFCQKLESETTDAAQYGVILAQGEGGEPPVQIQQQMEEEFGVSHRLQASLEKLMLKPE